MDRVQLSWANIASYDEQKRGAEQRRPGRVACERLACAKGRVLDLSKTGAKLEIRSLSAPRKGQRRALTFKAAMGNSSPFSCQIAWVRRLSWLRYEIGVEFTDLDGIRLSQIAEIARVHAERTWLNKAADHAA